MSADEFLQLVTQAVFLAVFIDVLVKAVRRPLAARIDIAVFFGSLLLILLIGDVERLGGLTSDHLLGALDYALVSALPYLLLRLADDFSPQPAWLMRLAPLGLAVLAVGAFASQQPRPVWLQVAPVAWFVVLGGYASVQFALQARVSRGVTARRMQAVAAGSGLFVLVLLLGGIALFIPDSAAVLGAVERLGAGVAGLAYFVGFSPPALLRRAWQEPELRAFLAKVWRYDAADDRDALVHALERGAAEALGAAGAVLGLWDPERNSLVYHNVEGELVTTPVERTIAGRAFRLQTPVFSPHPTREDPDSADVYRRAGAGAVLSAPVTAGEQRFGVLSVYARRPPVFSEGDLQLLGVLADQAAVALHNRALTAQAAAVQAREEAARLKDDFLSAAAHDLRTPLTTLLLHAEMLERATASDPTAPADPERVASIMREGGRLRSLVSEFLDATHAGRGSLLGKREPTDLVALANESRERLATDRHPVKIEASGPLVGEFVPDRLRQLLDNLVENAVKYTPDGGTVLVRMERSDDEARIEVADPGIGIPPEDLPHLFQRYRRGRERRRSSIPWPRPGPLHLSRDRGRSRRPDLGLEPAGRGHHDARRAAADRQPACRPPLGDRAGRGAAVGRLQNHQPQRCGRIRRWMTGRSWWSTTTPRSFRWWPTCSVSRAMPSRPPRTASRPSRRSSSAGRHWCCSTCACRSWMAGASPRCCGSATSGSPSWS